jgi:hypothetical protein
MLQQYSGDYFVCRVKMACFVMCYLPCLSVAVTKTVKRIVVVCERRAIVAFRSMIQRAIQKGLAGALLTAVAAKKSYGGEKRDGVVRNSRNVYKQS